MDWKALTSAEGLDKLIDRSYEQPQVIFKHSTRCATSSMAKNRLEKSSDSGNIEFSLLDVISQRPLSAKVAEKLDVWHESPQAILVLNGKAVYDESHISIRMDELKEQCGLHSKA